MTVKNRMRVFNFLFVSSGNKLSSVLPLLHPECHSLPEPNLLPGQLSHGAVGIHGGKVRWLSMAFESVSCADFELFILHVSTPQTACSVQLFTLSPFLRPHTRGNPPFRPTPTSSSGKTSSRSSSPPSRGPRLCRRVSRLASTGSRSSWKS